ncbi:hypothetical protein BaRGS_00020066 [Batillaria attramentaria]|uniref:BZIP domain-containing protein n=1 Tax=Batillaria attramentaria TaxID=370345 RepID=A0ABD0KNK1_9CAEN
MAETALDLSLNPSSSRLSDRVSTDSGRASADSACSEPLPEDRLHPSVSMKSRVSPSAPCASISPPTMSAVKTESKSHYHASTSEDEASGMGSSDQADPAKNSVTERVPPIRPFKMYPMDSLSMYNPLMAGAVGSIGTGGLGASVGLPSLYEPPSATATPTFNSFALTPLTSHLLQRKRRQEGRDRDRETSSKSPSTSSTPSTAAAGADDSDDSDPAKKALKLVPDEKKDEAYWERRRKNNEAAKRSRDARRQKEEEIAMRAAFLEQENLKLRAQVAILKNETAKLHYMLYNRI